MIVVSSLIACSLHEKMSCQTSRERDHGEGQHVEHNHPDPLTGHCRRLGAYIGRESFENLYSPNYEVKYLT